MPTSHKKHEANRKNAQKSTGPRTEKGKRHIKLNAVKHALYADPKNLPGEDPKQTAELVKQVREQHQPQGPLEEAAVNQIIWILQELRRIDRGYDVHLTVLINRQAVFRQRHRPLQKLDEIARTDPSSAKKNEVEEAKRVICESTKPEAEASDIEAVLEDSITDAVEVTVTDHVDRRKRQLMRDLDDAHTLLQDLQAARQPKMVILPPDSDGDRTSMTNQIEVPQRPALELYNNGTNKNVYAGMNAQDHVTIRSEAGVTIRRFATGLASLGASFLKNKAKLRREYNVLRGLRDAITRHFPGGPGPNSVAGITSENQTVEGSKGEG
jgi:hypothetical protein